VPDFNLVLAFLLVSCLSMVSQLLAFGRLAVLRARSRTEEMVSGGYARTVACRVLAATIYVVVAAVQLAGDGSLSAEALIVFSCVQVIWIANSLLDIRIRRHLQACDMSMGIRNRPGTARAPTAQLAMVAQKTEDLDRILDKLFVTVAELKDILSSAGEPGAPDQKEAPP
jgi:hypothetical protein